jgi:(1->4)-alpha-D-glucan 1-alpha-D-glucosylmutase
LATLHYRRQHELLFNDGAYIPLNAEGELAAHVCAFARRLHNEEIIVIAPRLMVGLINGVERPPLGSEVWGSTTLPLSSGSYRNLFTGEASGVHNRLDLAAALDHFPVALLMRE